MSTTYVRIGGTGDVASATTPLPVTATTGATGLGKAEDAVHNSGDVGVAILAVRKDTAAGLAADGDYHVLEVDSSGRLRIAALPANSGTDIGDVDVTSIAAGENVIGKMGAPDTFLTLNPTLDTTAQDAGDTLFDATELASVGRTSGGCVILNTLTIIDKADQKAAITVYFFDRTVTFGTADAAPSISDTDAFFYMGHVDINVSDYKDLGGASVAKAVFDPIMMKPNATSLWVAATTAGTPTYAANDLKFNFGFLRA